ncbi:MAG: sigma-70 family RNA polymerase sigma factor [Actinomycetota bacterium]|nr:sigma-70 family RNA polymerase sigma factor [Actinomycetota bacterium]
MTEHRVTAAAARKAEDVAGLVRAALGGDAVAWEALIGRFSGLVWSIVREYRLSAADSADVTQVVWLRLIEGLDRIRKPASLGSWLAQVARHECLRVVRSSTRDLPMADDIELDPGRLDHDIDHDLIVHERQEALTRAVDRLPPRWRAVLEGLSASPEPSYEEVAAALAMPIGSIGPTRQRCLERLRTSPELLALTAA